MARGTTVLSAKAQAFTPALLHFAQPRKNVALFPRRLAVCLKNGSKQFVGFLVGTPECSLQNVEVHGLVFGRWIPKTEAEVNEDDAPTREVWG